VLLGAAEGKRGRLKSGGETISLVERSARVAALRFPSCVIARTDLEGMSCRSFWNSMNMEKRRGFPESTVQIVLRVSATLAWL